MPAPATLLITTPYTSAFPDDPPRLAMPLGLAALATALRRENLPAIIYDSNLAPGIQADGDTWFAGDSYATITGVMRRHQPCLVGISVLYAKDAHHVSRLAAAAKSQFPACRVVAGGPHATVAARELLAGAPALDAVLRGPGEAVISDLAHWAGGSGHSAAIPGLVHRDAAGVIHENPPATTPPLTFPDLSLLDPPAYFSRWRNAAPWRLHCGHRLLPIHTSRGCRFHCAFCCVQAATGEYRAHSPARVIDHLTSLVRDWRLDAVQFEDDSLNSDPQHFAALVDGLAGRLPQLAWGTPNGIHAGPLADSSLVQAISRSSCRYLVMAVESGNADVLRSQHKPLDLDAVQLAARNCRRHRLPLFAFFMVGFPDETLAQIRETLAFAAALHRQYFVQPFVHYVFPYPGTELYATCHARGLLAGPLTPRAYALHASPRGTGIIRTADFSPDQLGALIGNFNHALLRSSALHGLRHLPVLARLLRLAWRNRADYFSFARSNLRARGPAVTAAAIS